MAKPAHPFRRLAAYWMDITLLYAVVLGLQFGLYAISGGVFHNWLARQAPALLYLWIFLTTSLLMWLYFILLESSFRQATLGKRLLKLQVTDVPGSRLSRTRAALRTAAKLAFFEIGHLSFLYPTPLFSQPDPPFRAGFAVLIGLMVLYFVLTWITPRRQSLHDLLASTLVVEQPAQVVKNPQV